jgi:hypothetical protein
MVAFWRLSPIGNIKELLVKGLGPVHVRYWKIHLIKDYRHISL